MAKSLGILWFFCLLAVNINAQDERSRYSAAFAQAQALANAYGTGLVMPNAVQWPHYRGFGGSLASADASALANAGGYGLGGFGGSSASADASALANAGGYGLGGFGGSSASADASALANSAWLSKQGNAESHHNKVNNG